MPYIYNPGYVELQEDTVLWRYMDFAKFSSILLSGKLFFSSITELQKNDPYEGLFLDEDLKHFLNQKFKHQSDAEIFEQVKETVIKLGRFIQTLSPSVFANCWYICKHESPAMWRLYTLQDQGIAIRTTYGRLKAAIKESSLNLQGSEVRYKNVREITGQWKLSSNLLDAFFIKRIEFNHEKEFRILVDGTAKSGNEISNGKSGLYVDVDLDTLIVEINLAPTAPTWYKNLVELMIKQVNLKKQVSISEFNNPPKEIDM